MEIRYLGSDRNPEQQVCTSTLLLIVQALHELLDIQLYLKYADSVGSRDVGLRNLES